MTLANRPDLALRRVIGLTAALFLSYLTVAMSLPAVPVHVVETLGLGNAWGGFAVGSAFLSTILTRGRAGAWSDRVGGKIAMQWGLLVYAASGLICLAAALPGLPPAASYGVLIAGRLTLGLGESAALVGMMGWAIGLMGPARSGRVISLVGMGLYGAFAAGGPLGLALLAHVGFAGLMVACTLLPMIGLVAIHRLPAVRPHAGPRESIWKIVGLIWRPGAAVGLQGIRFAALGAFFPLYFLSQDWSNAGLGLSFFGLGFVSMRLLFGHLPDRIGGRRVAAISLLVEACGQFLIWQAPGPDTPFVGAFLTGVGCSMVFPAMGTEVVKRVPAHLLGTAIGGFAAFQDLAYGATGPVVGVLADRAGYPSVFLIGGIAAALGLGMVIASETGRHQVMSS